MRNSVSQLDLVANIAGAVQKALGVHSWGLKVVDPDSRVKYRIILVQTRKIFVQDDEQGQNKNLLHHAYSCL